MFGYYYRLIELGFLGKVGEVQVYVFFNVFQGVLTIILIFFIIDEEIGIGGGNILLKVIEVVGNRVGVLISLFDGWDAVSYSGLLVEGRKESLMVYYRGLFVILLCVTFSFFMICINIQKVSFLYLLLIKLGGMVNTLIVELGFYILK